MKNKLKKTILVLLLLVLPLAAFFGYAMVKYFGDSLDVRWEFKVKNGVRHAPKVVGDVVYCAEGSDEAIFALDFKTGDKKWGFKWSGFGFSPLTVSDNIVFGVATEKKRIYAIDAKTGEEKWVFETRSYVEAAPVVKDGVVFFGRRSIYAVDIKTGKEKWRYEIDEGSVFYSPIICGNVIYFGCSGKGSYALDIKTGKEKWRVKKWRIPLRTSKNI